MPLEGRAFQAASAEGPV